MVPHDLRRTARRTPARYLSFEGVGTRADVYVNGTHLGQHVGAFTRFTFDASAAVADGPNVLAVRVSNHPDDTVDSLPSGRGKQLYRMYGGLYRKVWLIRTAAAHFDLLDHASSGVYVTPTGVTAGRRRARGADAGPQRGRGRSWSSSRASATRTAARWRSSACRYAHGRALRP